IMTTNAGADAIKNESAFGFAKPDDDASYDGMKTRGLDVIEKVFRPEIINRVNDVIVFRHLTEENLKHVVELEVAKVRERLGEKGFELDLSDDAKAFLVKKGSNTDYGARPLRRAIESFIEDPLAEELLKGEFAGKDTIRVEVKKVGDKKQLVFEGLQTKHDEPEPVAAGVGAEGDDAPADEGGEG
ncbi:MAG: NDP-hexose 4-ketoreductase, partial [Planctomycetota bacterium]